MAKPASPKTLQNLRDLLATKWKFTEQWIDDQLMFSRQEKFKLVVVTPIFGGIENMQMNPTKIIGFHLLRQENPELTYAMKNTTIRLDWQVFAEERIEAMMTLMDHINTCNNCHQDQLFPFFVKTLGTRINCSLKLKCEKCQTIIDFPAERAIELRYLQLSAQYA